MRIGSPLNALCAMRVRRRALRETDSGWIIALCCALSACLSVGCSHTAEVDYLSADEIRQTIVGNSLREAHSGDWREDYLPFDEDRLAGIIRGHQKPPDGFYGGTWVIDTDSMCLDYPALPDQGGCYRFARGEGGEILWVDSDGAVAYESVSIERRKTDSGSAKWAPSEFRRETVRFPHGENRVVGDLRLPEGSSPYPAVAFVHGSGPATRHSYYLESIGDEFLRRGFATLIWSKPGVDESTGDYLKQSMADRAEEVAAAMAHLAEREDIDGDRIGLWGISQAGWVMPMVSTHRSVAFVISVSGSAQTGREQDLYGFENELIRIGFSGGDLSDALDHRREFYELVGRTENYEAFSAGYEVWLEDMKSRSWYPAMDSRLQEMVFQSFVMSIGAREYEFISRNNLNGSLIAPPEWKNLDMPVLALYGSDDAIVDARLGSSAYREIPRLNGNPDVTVVVFDGADHGVMQPDPEGYLEFAPGFLAAMGEWAEKHR